MKNLFTKKKMTNMALAAALAGTGLTAAYVAEVPKASAAIVDDYNGLNAYSSGLFDLAQDVITEGSTYKAGNNIYFGAKVTSGSTIKHIKVYQIKSGGTMQRWKTYSSSAITLYTGSGVTIAEVYDKITTSYPAGQYIAVATFNNKQTISRVFDIVK